MLKYSVDEILDDIASLINIKTNEKKYVNINILPSNIKENDILVYDNNTYTKDLKEEEIIKKRIEEKMKMLRG